MPGNQLDPPSPQHSTEPQPWKRLERGHTDPEAFVNAPLTVNQRRGEQVSQTSAGTKIPVASVPQEDFLEEITLHLDLEGRWD